MWLQGVKKLGILTNYPLLGCFLQHSSLTSCFPTLAWTPSWLISDNIFALEEICYFKFLSWEKSRPLYLPSFDNCLGQQRSLKSFPIGQFFLLLKMEKASRKANPLCSVIWGSLVLYSFLSCSLLGIIQCF